MTRIPIVALVGRPNVGKSSLFNRLIGRKRAIVQDQPGTTRDRLYAQVEWSGELLDLVDTGGIQALDASSSDIEKGLKQQIDAALVEADLLLFLVDAYTPITQEDDFALNLIRKSKKPIILAVNKVDSISQMDELSRFYSLGLGEPMPVSAQSGRGTGDLLDAIWHKLAASSLEPAPVTDVADDAIKVAIVGRPNVGKSTLVNQLTQSDRVIVSEQSGTTRDTVDVRIEHEGQTFVLVDTAGIRRRARIKEGIEQYALIRGMQAVSAADVVFVLIDPNEGITHQDLQIIDHAVKEFKSIALIANKWDQMKDKHGALGVRRDQFVAGYEKLIRNELKHLSFIPFVTISALQGLRTQRLLELAKTIYQERHVQIPDKELHSVLTTPIANSHPPTFRGEALKVYSYSQIGVDPPTLEFVVNNHRLFNPSLERYLVNRLRDVYPFQGTPIRVKVRDKVIRKGKS